MKSLNLKLISAILFLISALALVCSSAAAQEPSAAAQEPGASTQSSDTATQGSDQGAVQYEFDESSIDGDVESPEDTVVAGITRNGNTLITIRQSFRPEITESGAGI